MKKLIIFCKDSYTFCKDSYIEVMENVTWSSYNTLQQSSVLVLITSVIFALLIGLIDFIFKGLLDGFYSSF